MFMYGICILCADPLHDDLLSTYCGHVFHRHCALSFIQVNQCCPQCRMATELSQLQPITVAGPVKGAMTKQELDMARQQHQQLQQQYAPQKPPGRVHGRVGRGLSNREAKAAGEVNAYKLQMAKQDQLLTEMNNTKQHDSHKIDELTRLLMYKNDQIKKVQEENIKLRKKVEKLVHKTSETTVEVPKTARTNVSATSQPSSNGSFPVPDPKLLRPPQPQRQKHVYKRPSKPPVSSPGVITATSVSESELASSRGSAPRTMDDLSRKVVDALTCKYKELKDKLRRRSRHGAAATILDGDSQRPRIDLNGRVKTQSPGVRRSYHGKQKPVRAKAHRSDSRLTSAVTVNWDDISDVSDPCARQSIIAERVKQQRHNFGLQPSPAPSEVELARLLKKTPDEPSSRKQKKAAADKQPKERKAATSKPRSGASESEDQSSRRSSNPSARGAKKAALKKGLKEELSSRKSKKSARDAVSKKTPVATTPSRKQSEREELSRKSKKAARPAASKKPQATTPVSKKKQSEREEPASKRAKISKKDVAKKTNKFVQARDVMTARTVTPRNNPDADLVTAQSPSQIILDTLKKEAAKSGREAAAAASTKSNKGRTSRPKGSQNANTVIPVAAFLLPPARSEQQQQAGSRRDEQDASDASESSARSSQRAKKSSFKPKVTSTPKAKRSSRPAKEPTSSRKGLSSRRGVPLAKSNSGIAPGVSPKPSKSAAAVVFSTKPCISRRHAEGPGQVGGGNLPHFMAPTNAANGGGRALTPKRSVDNQTKLCQVHGSQNSSAASDSGSARQVQQINPAPATATAPSLKEIREANTTARN